MTAMTAQRILLAIFTLPILGLGLLFGWLVGDGAGLAGMLVAEALLVWLILRAARRPRSRPEA